jgi:hypothetical protein
MSMLGGALIARARVTPEGAERVRLLCRAEPMLVEGHRQLLSNPGALAITKRAAVERLVALYELWARPDDAARYRSLLDVAAASPP